MDHELELLELDSWEDPEAFEDLELFENGHEGELGESDAFSFGEVWRRAPWGALRKAAVTAAATGVPAAVSGYLKSRGWMYEAEEMADEMAYLGERASEAESEQEADGFIGGIAGLAAGLLPMLLREGEAEGLGADEWEDLGEAEADPFLGALLPLAANVLPAAMPLIAQGVRAIGRALRESDPSGRSLQTLPAIATGAAKQVARKAQAGGKVTPSVVRSALVKQARAKLATPARAARAAAANRKRARRAVRTSAAKAGATRKQLRRQRLRRAV